MAKLMLIGQRGQVQLDRDDEGQVLARCVMHSSGRADQAPMFPACTWTETYDDMNDAVEYAADHADGR